MKFLIKKLGRVFDIFEKAYARTVQDEYRSRYDIDDSFRFNGKRIQIYGEGVAQFGANSYIGEGSTWQVYDGCKIVIGKGCKISHLVRAYTYSNDADADFSLAEIPKKKGDIVIGDYVWIGANVMINPGINIGTNSVIGANSVVTKDIPPHSIYGGVPAKLIRVKRMSR